MMSILVRDQQTGKVYLFAKGADSAIISLTPQNGDQENVQSKITITTPHEGSSVDVIKPVKRTFFRTKSQEELGEIETQDNLFG
jgi:hypothetical protein